jgi:hypothetical protein
MVVAGIVAAMIPMAEPGWRFAVMAIAVGLFAAISLNQIALAVVAVLAFAISDGFLENQIGQLTWHGSADLWRLLLLVMAAVWGLALGEAVRFVANLRVRWAAEADRMTAETSGDRHTVGAAAEDPVPAPWSSDTLIALRFGIFVPERRHATARDAVPPNGEPRNGVRDNGSAVGDWRDIDPLYRLGQLGELNQLRPLRPYDNHDGDPSLDRDPCAAPDRPNARPSGDAALPGPRIGNTDESMAEDEKYGA